MWCVRAGRGARPEARLTGVIRLDRGFVLHGPTRVLFDRPEEKPRAILRFPLEQNRPPRVECSNRSVLCADVRCWSSKLLAPSPAYEQPPQPEVIPPASIGMARWDQDRAPG